MKISRDSLIPQIELGPRLGGAKQLFERSGIVTRLVTMGSAMIAAYSTTPELQALLGSFVAFVLVVLTGMAAWMAFDFMVLYPSEQSFAQEQAQRAERSPLKRDTERILSRLDGGGERQVVVPECKTCGRPGQSGEHRGESVIACPECGGILYRTATVSDGAVADEQLA